MSMEQKVEHTPGEWYIDQKMVGNVMGERLAYRIMGPRISGRGTRCVAEVQCLDFAEGKFNARLIAAAPDLLAALQRVIEWNDRDAAGELDEAWDCETMIIAPCRAAITKATA